MSKIKKLLSVVIVMAISILAFTNITNAAYSIGQTLQINYSDYLDDDNLFCVEHHQNLRGKKVTYKVISQVNIEGNV